LVTYPGDVSTGPTSGSIDLNITAGATFMNENFGIQPTSTVLPQHPSANPFGNANSNADVDTAFVKGLYHLVLNRDADAGGLASWVTALENNTVSFAQVSTTFYHSTEYLTDLVESYYVTYLGRQGDAGGVASWVAALASGATVQQVVFQFLASPEYSTLHSSNVDFVESLYANILGRTGDSGGVTSFVNSLNSGTPRGAIIPIFLGSAEHDERVIQSLYVVFLARQGESSGVQGWLTNLEAGSTTFIDMAAAFAGSGEFVLRAEGAVG
jgi:hypothetical protein